MAVTDTLSGVMAKVYSVTGPASYATGGFLKDVSADFSWIGFVDIIVNVRGVLPADDFEFLHNRSLAGAEAFGQVVVKCNRGRYDKASIGDPSGNPSGTTVRAAKFAAATTVGSNHTHAIDHDHPAVNSANETASGTLGVLLAGGGGNMRNHLHSFDVPNFTGSGGASTHTHDRSFEYGHTHALNTSTADATLAEIANGTNLSGVTFVLTVYGFGKQ